MRKQAKKAAALLALAALLLSLCGCAAGQEIPTIRVGVALYLQEDTFISTVVQNLEQLARVKEEALGIKLNLNFADARSSQASQNEQVDRFLQQGCDVICVNLVDRTAAAVIVDKAQAAGVPIIFFNRQPVEEDLDRWEQAYYVGSKADRAGILPGPDRAGGTGRGPCRPGPQRRRRPAIRHAGGRAGAPGRPAADGILHQDADGGRQWPWRSWTARRRLGPGAGLAADAAVAGDLWR